MKKTKHTEEKIIGAAGARKTSRANWESAIRRSTKGEVQRHGCQRREEAEGARGREPASEAAGCRSQSRQRGADHAGATRCAAVETEAAERSGADQSAAHAAQQGMPLDFVTVRWRVVARCAC